MVYHAFKVNFQEQFGDHGTDTSFKFISSKENRMPVLYLFFVTLINEVHI